MRGGVEEEMGNKGVHRKRKEGEGKEGRKGRRRKKENWGNWGLG